MKKAVIFIGPSLDTEKARQILDVEYRPPARKGDFMRLTTSLDDTRTIVGLVDGYFLLDYPPTPIEVYQLIVRRNIHVIGSSSIGALRAVELEKFGMIGVGTIFELFKCGKLDADDEVAVTFTEDYHLQSEAMIDIRYNLFLSWRKGIIDKETRDIVTKVAKGIYFPFRTYQNIVSETARRFPRLNESVRVFETYIHTNRKSLKERDALRLIKHIKNML